MSNPDFGKFASDYARYRAGFPEELFVRLQHFGVGKEGQRVLDLGTGTGTLARGFAKKGCRVTGLDPSKALIAEAQKLDEKAKISIHYINAAAEDTGLASGSFDVISAGQCWHWFDAPRVFGEIKRLLVPGGVLLIAHFDWLPLLGNVVEATETLMKRYEKASVMKSAVKKVIRRFRPAWGQMWGLMGGTGVHPERLNAMQAAGFRDIESFSFDKDVNYSHEAWRGRVRTHAGIGASLPPEQVKRFDKDLQGLLNKEFSENPLHVPHRVFAVIGKWPDLRMPEQGTR